MNDLGILIDLTHAPRGKTLDLGTMSLRFVSGNLQIYRDTIYARDIKRPVMCA